MPYAAVYFGAIFARIRCEIECRMRSTLNFLVKTVKRLTSYSLFLALALALIAPAVAHAGSKSSHPLTPQQQEQAKTYKKYQKDWAKKQKKQAKNQKKQLKQWQKQHQSTTTVT
jgi:hypothetical protein